MRGKEIDIMNIPLKTIKEKTLDDAGFSSQRSFY